MAKTLKPQLTPLRNASVPDKGEVRHPINGYPGLYFRVKANGLKSWVYRVKIGGKADQIGLGSFDETGRSMNNALADAAKFNEWRREGLIPSEEHKREKAEVAAARAEERGEGVETVGSFLDRWYKRVSETPKSNGEMRSEKTLRNYSDLCEKRIKPAFGDRPISLVSYGELEDFTDDISDASTRNQTIVCLRGAFKIAKKRGVIQQNPTLDLERVAVKKRDNRLSDDELRWMWQAAGDIGPFGPVVRLIMLTGLRLNEAQQLRWDEVKGAVDVRNSDGELALPEHLVIGRDRMKGDRDHFVPLAAQASEIIEDMREFKINDYVFAGRSGNRPLGMQSTGMEKLRQRMAAIREEETGEAFDHSRWKRGGDQDLRLHDLRRNLGSTAQALGYAPNVADLQLSHAVDKGASGTQDVYLLHDYKRERVEMMHAWADHLMGIVAPRPLRPDQPSLRAVL